VTAHAAAVVDTNVIAALRLYDRSEFPGTIFITALPHACTASSPPLFAQSAVSRASEPRT
jgi:hypothetical protein